MPEYFEYKETFVNLPNHTKGILYGPAVPSGKESVGMVCLHSHGDYQRFSAGPELAKRGYRILCSGTKGEIETMEDKVRTVATCVDYVKNLPGIKKVLLVTHSGGGTLMSCYQAIAENGVEIFRKPENLYPFGDVGGIPVADGVITLDSNWGNSILTALSVSPMIIEEGCGMKLDSRYDFFEPSHGYNPLDPDFEFDEEFIRYYNKAQIERNNRIVNYAAERYKAIENGEGKFIDDEPFIVAGASAQGPKFYSYSPKRLSHSRIPRSLMHADGTVTEQIVPVLAQVGGRKPDPRKMLQSNSVLGTIRVFLSNYAVRLTDDLYFTEDTLTGIDYDSTCCSTTANVRYIHKPFLVMGMTGGLGVCCNEHIFDNIPAEDKTLMYIEGAEHMFTPNKRVEKFPGQFGDTMKNTYDYVNEWVWESGRFAE